MKSLIAAVAFLCLTASTFTGAWSSDDSVKGCYGKDSSDSRFDHILAAGFNTINRAAYLEYLDELPAGTKALVWLGNYVNSRCAWEKSDRWIRSHVEPIAGHPAIVAYYLADEPRVWACPNAPAQLKKRSDLVKSLDPANPTFAVIAPHSPGNPYTPYVDTVDIVGVDRYPCSHSNGCVMSKIDSAISLVEQAGIDRYWGILQAFEDSYYRMPTPDELREQFRRWRLSNMEGYLVFSWSWGDEILEDHPSIVRVLQEENVDGLPQITTTTVKSSTTTSIKPTTTTTVVVTTTTVPPPSCGDLLVNALGLAVLNYNNCTEVIQ